ncbi:molybdopterin molybdotransferase MoeA [Natronomonas sp. F2-12]|uniref:Molybdopterin molybdotransferase MoeA n=1 Tax=Natronomonas aquatica TaxID=2841590 RepID=A0A9R1CU73_9EURY|nr:gephyrin-like molybdotransferase Glp [Natronomonas aquatica]MCQ4333867.1 molybdopterin molybdotransferase MoeA [Natronomonas aquatica]
MSDLQEAGFKDRTRIEDARDRLLDTPPIDRTERLSLSVADGRTVAEPIEAVRNVPHYARAAMDGWALKAEDTFGASDRSPAVLRPGETVGPDRAVRVHTGSELPEDADAVVMIEDVDRIGEELEVFDAVAAGENVAPVGEDVEAGQRLYDPGHRLRPSDLGLLKGTGIDTVEIVEKPEVAVIPTGEELVQADPEPGEVVETNRFTISRLAERWGADVTRREIVTDDHETLRAAVQRDLTRDVVVTTGGSSVGERDLIPEVVADLGEVFVHGVALKPGHPVALGRIEGVTVVMLPGYPVACIVNAVQFLRPLVKHLGRMPIEPLPSREATLTRKLKSEPGVRTFARVKLEESEAGLEATPTRAGGSGVLSSVALADGWVAVPESAEGIAAGETVTVENWEYNG